MIDRRILLGAIAGSTLFPKTGAAQPTSEEKLPRLSGNIMIAARQGYRPERKGGFRLEVDNASIDPALIIHNYGHGGAGITLSMGCAVEVCQLLQAIPNFSQASDVAVLGAGIIGLSTAHKIMRTYSNKRIIIYRHKKTDRTTSVIAGGQFYPAGARPDNSGPERDKFDCILKKSWDEFHNLTPSIKYGIVKNVPNYTINQNLSEFPDNFHQPQLVDGSVFPEFSRHRNIYKFDTILIQVPKLMQQLEQELMESGRVRFLQGIEINSRDRIKNTKFNFIINCMGENGGRFFGEEEASRNSRKKGYLAFLNSEWPNVKYAFSGGSGDNNFLNYMFSRPDHLVIGGTYGEPTGPNLDTPDKIAARLVMRMDRLLRGMNPDD
jgi:D-amino-acid oxidase